MAAGTLRRRRPCRQCYPRSEQPFKGPRHLETAAGRCQGEAVERNTPGMQQPGRQATEDVMNPDDLVFHPWVVQGPREVPTMVGGSGSHVVDVDGRRYLDFSSQLVFTN